MQPFMSVERLKNFNDTAVKESMGLKSQKPVTKDMTKQNVPYDPNKFDSFIVPPSTLDDQILYGISNLFDDKVSAMNTEFIGELNKVSPNTVDKIMSAIAVAYITEDGMPVAACVIRDPSATDYRGVIPADYIEMRTGIDLENRLEQEYFEIHPDYHGKGLAAELRRLINTVVDATFIAVPSNDTDTIIGLSNAGYKMVSTFRSEGDMVDTQLWLS